MVCRSLALKKHKIITFPFKSPNTYWLFVVKQISGRLFHFPSCITCRGSAPHRWHRATQFEGHPQQSLLFHYFYYCTFAFFGLKISALKKMSLFQSAWIKMLIFIQQHFITLIYRCRRQQKVKYVRFKKKKNRLLDQSPTPPACPAE